VDKIVQKKFYMQISDIRMISTHHSKSVGAAQKKTRAMTFALSDGTTSGRISRTIQLPFRTKRKEDHSSSTDERTSRARTSDMVDVLQGKRSNTLMALWERVSLKLPKCAAAKEEACCRHRWRHFWDDCRSFTPKEFDVHVFEANDAILAGATGSNQFRHHWDTIIHVVRDDPRNTGRYKDFSEWYARRSLMISFVLCDLKRRVIVSAKEFKDICAKSMLKYTEEMPDPTLVDPSSS